VTAAPNPRLSPPWLQEPATQRLIAALNAADVAARFVGGIVRDTLLDPSVEPAAASDIDLATPARPEQVSEALISAGIKVVPTGLTHGTVTAIVPPRHFEITTLRRDVETDGRHARVAFDADWEADARRRDFTINALYLAPDGTLHDPVGGLPDLRAGRVRFVGDPAQRIAEDVLRLLRYYRFEARFGSGAGDPPARAACRAAVPLLPTLSAERVAQELIKLLQARDPSRAVRMMQEDGVLAAILPEAARLDRLQRLIALEPEPDALRRLAALITVDCAGAAEIGRRLRFSTEWRDRLAGLAAPSPLDPAGDTRAQRRSLYRVGADRYCDLVLLAAAENRLGEDRLRQLLDLARRWRTPGFPIGGRDVTALGIAPGPRVGALLQAVQSWWEDGDFAADRDACLARLSELADAGMPRSP